MPKRWKKTDWRGKPYPEHDHLTQELMAKWCPPDPPPALPQGQPQPRTDLDDRVDEYLRGMLGEESR